MEEAVPVELTSLPKEYEGNEGDLLQCACDMAGLGREGEG